MNEKEQKNEKKSEKGKNCLECKHFYVTWDQSFPKGCKVYGIKSQQMPSVLVKKTSGMDCQAFLAKRG